MDNTVESIPKSYEKITPDDFNDRMVKVGESLNALYNLLMFKYKI